MKATYNNNTTIYIQTMSQSSMKSPNILSTSWRGDNYFSKWVYQGLKHWTLHCTCYSMIMGNIYIYIINGYNGKSQKSSLTICTSIMTISSIVVTSRLISVSNPRSAPPLVYFPRVHPRAWTYDVRVC